MGKRAPVGKRQQLDLAQDGELSHTRLANDRRLTDKPDAEIARIAIQHHRVRAGTAEDGVEARAQEDPIVPRSRLDHIDPGTAIEDVIAACAHQPIATRTAAQAVRLLVADQLVGPAPSENDLERGIGGLQHVSLGAAEHEAGALRQRQPPRRLAQPIFHARHDPLGLAQKQCRIAIEGELMLDLERRIERGSEDFLGRVEILGLKRRQASLGPIDHRIDAFARDAEEGEERAQIRQPRDEIVAVDDVQHIVEGTRSARARRAEGDGLGDRRQRGRSHHRVGQLLGDDPAQAVPGEQDPLDAVGRISGVLQCGDDEGACAAA